MEGIIAMMLKAKSYEITKRSVERGKKKKGGAELLGFRCGVEGKEQGRLRRSNEEGRRRARPA